MKKILTIIILIFLAVNSFGNEILKNNNFMKQLVEVIPDENGRLNTQENWTLYLNSGAKADVGVKDGVLYAKSKKINAPDHGAQLIQAPLLLEGGGKYKLSFKARTLEDATKMTIKIGADGYRQYYSYFQQNIEIKNTDFKEYEYVFDMMAATDENTRFEFWFTKTDSLIEIKDVSLIKIGEISVNNRLGIVKFDPNKKYKVLMKDENALTVDEEEKIKSLIVNEEFTKNITFEKDTTYSLRIENLSGKEQEIEVTLIGENENEEIIKKLHIKKGEKLGQLDLKYIYSTTDIGILKIKKISKSRFEKSDKIVFEKNYGNLIWQEEFNYTGMPDSSKWSYDIGGHGWGNSELQLYRRSGKNAYVENDVLNITAIRERKGNNRYTSARLITKDKADFKYGRFEIKAKLPKGRGIWPAIWMMPTDSKYGGWPKSGEIDIMEHVGYDPSLIHGTIHTGKYSWLNANQKKGDIESGKPYDEFQIYALEWTPEVIKIYKDDILYFIYENQEKTVEAWPFNQEFYLILNIAVGGSWGGQKGIDNTIFPQVMEIDYIRVYDLGLNNK